MKIKEGFMLREVDGNVIVVAVGEASLSFNGMITMNTTGRFLWEKLTSDTTEEALVADMVSAYDVDKEIAVKDVRAFVEKLEKGGILEA